MQLDKITENFHQELRAAQNGVKTSLQFIKHTLSLQPLVEENEQFQVIRLGGSICQRALIKKQNGKLEIITKEESTIPVFNTKEKFLHFIENNLDPHVTKLAINFAYPLEPVFRDNVLDGKLLYGTKEHTFGGLVDKNVGETLEKYFKRKYHRQLHISVANDTICLLLSGLTQYSWDSIAAGIVGTGINFAIFLSANSCVNLESANFDKFEQSETGQIIDRHSANHGGALFEKEVSGRYLYEHFNIQLESQQVAHPPITSTKALHEIAVKQIPQVSDLARRWLLRSAQLLACQVAGITRFHQKDMTFIIEGSLFWEAFNYKETVMREVAALVPKQKVHFINIPDSGVLGAAKLIA